MHLHTDRTHGNASVGRERLGDRGQQIGAILPLIGNPLQPLFLKLVGTIRYMQRSLPIF
jgi:hypothetical protein